MRCALSIVLAMFASNAFAGEILGKWSVNGDRLCAENAVTTEGLIYFESKVVEMVESGCEIKAHTVDGGIDHFDLACVWNSEDPGWETNLRVVRAGASAMISIEDGEWALYTRCPD